MEPPLKPSLSTSASTTIPLSPPPPLSSQAPKNNGNSVQSTDPSSVNRDCPPARVVSSPVILFRSRRIVCEVLVLVLDQGNERDLASAVLVRLSASSPDFGICIRIFHKTETS